MEQQGQGLGQGQSGQPQAGQPQQPTPPTPQPSQSGTTGAQSTSAQSTQGAASQATGAGQATTPPVVKRDLSPFVTKIVLPQHHLDLNDNYFLKLLAGSLSLSVTEKKRIIDSIPTLSQYQVDKLIEIFEEERVKFADLEARMPEQVQKLRDKQHADWEILELEVEKNAKKSEDDQKADEIRKKLGLS